MSGQRHLHEDERVREAEAAETGAHHRARMFFSAALGFACDSCQAGASPKAIPVSERHAGDEEAARCGRSGRRRGIAARISQGARRATNS